MKNKNKFKKKNENTQYHGTFISFKCHLHSKQRSPTFLLCGPCNVGSSQSFSDNSNLIILVDIQHLHENGK